MFLKTVKLICVFPLSITVDAISCCDGNWCILKVCMWYFVSRSVACVAGVRKGRGKEFKTPFPKTPFPFPFKRLPRRLRSALSRLKSAFRMTSDYC